MIKKLIFSNLQKFDYNNKNNYFLGPWVFLEKKNIEDILIKNTFKKTFDRNNSIDDSKYLINLSNDLVKKIGTYLNENYDCKFSFDYWKIILGPSFIYYAQIMYEKFKLIDALLKTEDVYECEILNIKEFPKFETSRDILNFLKSNYGNYFLFSLIIDEINSPQIMKKYINNKIQYNNKHNYKNSIFDKLKMFSDLFLSLNTNNFIHRIKGINFSDKIKLKSKKNKKKLPKKLLEIEAFLRLSVNKNINPNEIKSNNSSLFEQICINFSKNFIPNYLFRNFIKKNLMNLRIIKFFKLWNKKIVLGPILGGNDTVKILIALLKDLNVQIFVHQHGGYYGLTKTFTTMAYIEYLSADKFISWGWLNHSNYKVNAVPLPIPQISKIKIKNSNLISQNKLMFIGTDMPIIFERFGTTPQPQEFIYYLNDKLKIIKNLSKNIKLSYRPYFYNASSLNEQNFFKNNNIKLNYLKTNFETSLNDYNLILLDHPGTIMNLSISSNKPIIIYINLNIWEFSKEIRYYLDELNKAGIVQYDINSCSEFINNLFRENVNIWWNKKYTQEKLNIFKNKFAISSNTWIQNWRDFLNEQ